MIILTTLLYLAAGAITYIMVRQKYDPVDIVIATILFWPLLVLFVILGILILLKELIQVYKEE